MKKSRFTEEQIVRTLHEAESGQKSQAEICRDHGVSTNTFYLWKRKYSGLQTDDLRRLRELERENDELKRLVAERDLEISAVRKVFRKTGWRSRASFGSEATDGRRREGSPGMRDDR